MVHPSTYGTRFKFPPRVPFFFYDSFAPLLMTFEEFNFSFSPRPLFSFSRDFRKDLELIREFTS